MKIDPRLAKIPWWAIIGAFIIGLGSVGVVLLVLKLLGESAAEKDKKGNTASFGNTADTEVKGQTKTKASYSYIKKNASDVEYKPASEQNSRPGGASEDKSRSAYGQSSADAREPGQTKKEEPKAEPKGSASYSFDTRGQMGSGAKADIDRLFPRRYGKVLSGFGMALMIVGMAASLVGLGTAAVGGDIGGLLAAIVTSSLLCLPGGIMFVMGKTRQAKASRFRKYHRIIGDGRSMNIEVLAEAIPTTYDKACRDLQEMIDAGFFAGMFIDASSGCLTDNYDRLRRKKTAKAAKKNRDGEFAEEARIRELNDIIEDAYVSERMDRLESLTHSILEYVEKNPHKEGSIRQFKNHYLPTTIKILEAYAKFEQQESRGANVAAAMEDVEKIMDKLVSGFEKQLDALYDDEALDIASDIDVLENMMDMSGLTSSDFRL